MEKRVRFDDMLATVLARPADQPAAKVVQWRQILDLLAQRRIGVEPELGREALDRLRSLRAEVPVETRRETARGFSGRPIPAPLVAFLAADLPVVAGAILGSVRLPENDWLTILPRLSPTGRGFLRHRRDLGSRIEGALASFGATDLALNDEAVPVAEAPEPAEAVVETTKIIEPAATLPEPQPIEESDTVPEPAVQTILALEPEPVSIALSAVEAPVDLEPEPDHDVPVETAEALEPGSGEGQIRAIISRIAHFKQHRDDAFPFMDMPVETTEHFRFETSPDGVIRWVEGAPRGPLVGEVIATPAVGAYGVDAQAPGAFRRRAPFRDARLVVAGNGPASGEWRIAGVPVFASSDGRFMGYRGIGRRPRPGEQAIVAAVAEPAGLYGGGLPADSLRQLVHELRTPLNAIGGFAEMIRRQMRGPIATPYRDRAQAITEQAGRLLAAVDDLDVAARLETQRLELQRLAIDLGAMLGAVCVAHADITRHRNAELIYTVADGLPQADGDPAAVRRMLSRLVAASTALASDGETIRAGLDKVSGEGPALRLFVTRPARLAGLGETELLDPGYGPEGDWPDAPLLGLGFSLHLVRRLAAAAGGSLAIEEESFVLRLPVVQEAVRADVGA